MPTIYLGDNEKRYEKFDWLRGWGACDAQQQGGLERQLQDELSPGHALYGVPVTVMGRAEGSDDLLLSILDFTGRFAEVHLTWARGVVEAPYPWTTIYPSWETWMEAVERETGTTNLDEQSP
jgi:hypothetical protein